MGNPQPSPLMDAVHRLDVGGFGKKSHFAKLKV